MRYALRTIDRHWISTQMLAEGGKRWMSIDDDAPGALTFRTERAAVIARNACPILSAVVPVVFQGARITELPR